MDKLHGDYPIQGQSTWEKKMGGSILGKFSESLNLEVCWFSAPAYKADTGKMAGVKGSKVNNQSAGRDTRLLNNDHLYNNSYITV